MMIIARKTQTQKKSNDGKEDEDDGSWHNSNFDFGAIDGSGSNTNAGPDSVNDDAHDDVIWENKLKPPVAKMHIHAEQCH